MHRALRPLALILLAIALTLVGSQNVLAQQGGPPAGGGITPQCQEGCGGGGGVEVTPARGERQYLGTSSGANVTFWVQNNYSTAKWVYFTCTPTGVVTGCTTEFPKLYLSPGTSVDLTVYYQTGASAGAGTVRLLASAGGSDEGQYPVQAVQPGVTLVNHRDDSWDRSRCVVIGAAEAVVQCGDLVVTHGTPAIRTLGTARALTLVYTSKQARPQVSTVAEIRLDPGAPVPATIVARLRINGMVVDTGSYPGWGGLDPVRRVALRAFLDTLPTGVHPIAVEATTIYGSQSYTTSTPGYVAVVNRRASPFGRGWWISGLEQLVLGQPTGVGNDGVLWVGADGSARLYKPVGTNLWRAPAGAFRDTISYDPGVGEYRRRIKHGVEVIYDQLGRHKRTVNRLGHATLFAWNAGGQLSSVTLPPAGASGTAFSLHYSTAGFLDSIVSPGARTTRTSISTGDLTVVTDPDGTSALYSYDPEGRMVSFNPALSLTQIRGRQIEYERGLRVSRTRISYDASGALQAETILKNWDELGLPGSTSVLPSDSYTEVDGPRTDVVDRTRIWVNAWGAPEKSVDALGNTTFVSYGDAGMPALATRVLHPNEAVDSAEYSARGNLTRTLAITTNVQGGSLPTRIATYQYGSTLAPDSPTRVEDVFGRGATYTYNSMGLTQAVTDARGLVTQFTYEPTGSKKGLLLQVQESGDSVWRQSDSTEVALPLVTIFTYDDLGNLRTSKAPSGTVTSFVNDGLGRVTDVYDPFGRRTQRVYDAWNRVTALSEYRDAQSPPVGVNPLIDCRADHVSCVDESAPPHTGIPVKLTTTYEYGPFGVEKVTDPRGVDRSYLYDARGLVYREYDENGAPKTATYDPSGLVTTLNLRGWSLVTFSYDAAGRRTSLSYPARSHVTQPGITIPGDNISYSYDAMGNRILASNRHGTIRRTFFGDGSLQSQVAVIGPVWDSLAYDYDAVGARTRLAHARSPSVVDVAEYFYWASSGDLSSVRVTWGSAPAPYQGSRTFSFAWDKHGRRRQVVLPSQAGSTSITYRYDLLGQLRRLESLHPGSPVSGQDHLDFTLTSTRVDAVGRVLSQRSVCGAAEAGSPCGSSPSKTTDNVYDRRGQLVGQTTAGLVQQMRYDASGNLRWKKVGLDPADSFHVESGRNRLARTITAGREDLEHTYNPEGSRLWDRTDPAGYRDRAYYYDGLGRTAGFANWVDIGGFLAWADMPDLCRYDPDGQLVVPCANAAPWLAFDGANVTRGGTWSFIHGPGVDDPLIGLNRWPTGQIIELYYVTDGNGRQYTVARGDGSFSEDDQSLQGNAGWNYAGGNLNAQTFTADRMASAEAPGLAFFRNRVYDQASGRWTQEDPIGIAGGINLYQFNGNNPVAFTDPFGLASEGPCPPCDVTDWSALYDHVIPKHVEGTQGSASLFVDMDEKALRHGIETTVKRGHLVEARVVAGERRFTFERVWKGAVGTKGETAIRVVVNEAGELRTAFPVKVGAKGLGAGLAGAARRAGRVAGTAAAIVGIITELTFGATPAH